MKLHPVVLSGGSGTRLWPLSRDNFPKQFLPIFGRSTLLQETLLRLDGLTDVAPAVVVCNEAHRFLAMDQLRQIGKEPLDIIIEPVARNTAPALTLAALALTERDLAAATDPIMLVMPSDHLIRDGETRLLKHLLGNNLVHCQRAAMDIAADVAITQYLKKALQGAIFSDSPMKTDKNK